MSEAIDRPDGWSDLELAKLRGMLTVRQINAISRCFNAARCIHGDRDAEALEAVRLRAAVVKLGGI